MNLGKQVWIERNDDQDDESYQKKKRTKRSVAIKSREVQKMVHVQQQLYEQAIDNGEDGNQKVPDEKLNQYKKKGL